MVRTVLVAVSVFALLGCSSPPVEMGAADSPSTTPPVPSPQSESPPVESPPEEPETVEVLESCTDQQLSGAQYTVTSQTDALRDGDFDAAYSYASPGFQSVVTLEQFSALILASYQPLLAANATLEFGECLVGNGAEQLAIDVVLRGSGENALGLRYILVDGEQGWSVDGASNIAVGGRAT